MVRQILLPLACSLTGALAQFAAVTPEITFSNTASEMSFLSDFASYKSSQVASMTKDPNWVLFTNALPSEEASQISVGINAAPTDDAALSAAEAVQTWPTAIPSEVPTSAASWVSSMLTADYCGQSSVIHKYGGSVPSATGVTCPSSGASGLSHGVAAVGMPALLAAGGGIAAAALLL